ncbi:MAG: hypothetical protein ACYC4N_07775 [Pirellulaceae bacterium]
MNDRDYTAMANRSFWSYPLWVAMASGLFTVLSLIATVLLPGSLLQVLLAGAAVTTAIVACLPTRSGPVDVAEGYEVPVPEKICLEPLPAPDLPKAVRGYFDKNTSALLQAGFELLGDYRLTRHGRCFARFFLNSECDTFAELRHTQRFISPVRAVSFFSLTPAGHYLESSNMRFVGKHRAVVNFELQRMPGRTVIDIYDFHQNRLRQLDHAMPRLLEHDDLELVIYYGNTRLYEMLIEQGTVSVNPYADFDERSLWMESASPWECRLRVFAPTWDEPAPVSALTP